MKYSDPYLPPPPPGWQVALLEPNYKAPALDNIKPLQGKTMITIEKETRDVLRKLAAKGQTYDNLIREMIVKCYSAK